jgi:hypothetical protein
VLVGGALTGGAKYQNPSPTTQPAALSEIINNNWRTSVRLKLSFRRIQSGIRITQYLWQMACIV